jgi:hypothetical protein
VESVNHGDGLPHHTTTSIYKHSYLIHSLAMDSAYQLEISARNSYGWSSPSKLHTFFTSKGKLLPFVFHKAGK